jgi:hypothetical protein
MNQDDALDALEDAEVVTCLTAAIPDAKEVLAACLEEEIPALLDRGECCSKAGCGCAPKLDLLVRPEDVPRVARLLQRRWHGMLSREGTVETWGPAEPTAGANAEPTSDAEPPCPACGHSGPLADGACAGCGLHLG